MMYERTESEYFTAKRKAARLLGFDSRYRPKDLPSNREIRDQIQILAELHEGESRSNELKAMRFEALWLMRKLKRFKPALIGSVLTGHIRKGSDVDLHVFSDQVAAVTMTLDELGWPYSVERKRIVKHGEERVFTHVHVSGKYEFELTIYAANQASYTFKSSITGKAIERATFPQLEQFLQTEYPDADLNASDDEQGDRYVAFKHLLLPLEAVKQPAKWHPEGDALFHSLQVFDLARGERPYDEEFLLAALLHDVGKAIDPFDHVSAGLQALENCISDRTAFLIEHHMDAHDYRDGTLGHRAALRLKQSEDFEDLLLLSELDKLGRVPGALVGTVQEALDYLRNLEQENG